MTKQSLMLRKIQCQQDRLCFISLRKLDGEIALKKHSDVSLILVDKRYDEEIDLVNKKKELVNV